MIDEKAKAIDAAVAVAKEMVADRANHWEIAHAVIEAYESAKQKGEAEGWRDIESAPKDGTNILLAHARAVFDGYWDAYANGWVDDVTDLYEDKITYQATHWRPLPEPPMLSAGGEG